MKTICEKVHFEGCRSATLLKLKSLKMNFSLAASDRPTRDIIFGLKTDLNSRNVSRAADTIRWQMVFLNLDFSRTKCSVYLTNLFFLLTRSGHWNMFDKIVIYLWSYALCIIRQGVHPLLKLQAGRTNRWTTTMKSSWPFSAPREWNKNMWSCAPTDTGHAQRNCLIVEWF